ncbi:MAG: hypothetical protein AB7G48_02800 [Nitrospiraceae bacterium]
MALPNHVHPTQRPRRRWRAGLGLALVASLWSFLAAQAVTMTNDPRDFEGIPWGAELKESDDLHVVDRSPRIVTYERESGPPSFGGHPVESMKFVAIDGKFSRVTIRYQSLEAHKSIVAYLESRFGLLDRTPGQIANISIQTFNWKGPETDIMLTFNPQTQQGIIFYESQSLAQRFYPRSDATPRN